MKVDFYRHSLGEIEKRAIADVLDSVMLSTGNLTAEFERKFAQYLGVSHAIGVMSCTHALELALRGLGIGPGDEVITTPMTFIATANAIQYVGAKPIFVDTELETGLMDVAQVASKINERTRAILPVHLYGALVDMRALRTLADQYQLKIVEDCAHCVEGQRDGVGPGQLGDAACFSFYATKNLTCGEGGAITTNDEELATWLRKARLHGMSKGAADRYGSTYQHWDMEFLGYKSNLTNVQAALLLPQLDYLEERRERREVICRRYEKAFSEIKDVSFTIVPDGTRSARHLFTIRVNPNRRDHILNNIQAEGVGVAVNYRAIHLLSFYQKTCGFQRGTFPHAEQIGDSTITLPLYPTLSEDAVETVIAAVEKACA